MKPAFPATTQQPNISSVNGEIHTLCIKTKPRKSCQQSKACWWSFLTMRALFIRNLFVLTKQLTIITARRLFNIWGSKPLPISGTMAKPDSMIHH